MTKIGTFYGFNLYLDTNDEELAKIAIDTLRDAFSVVEEKETDLFKNSDFTTYFKL